MLKIQSEEQKEKERMDLQNKKLFQKGSK